MALPKFKIEADLYGWLVFEGHHLVAWKRTFPEAVKAMDDRAWNRLFPASVNQPKLVLVAGGML